MIQLRDYQQDQLALGRIEMKHTRRPLFCAPTGSGKTTLAAYMLQGAMEKNDCMFLVHQNELLAQTSRAFTRYGLPHGIIAAGHQSTEHRLQIASLQTLINRTDAIKKPTFLVIDEGHRAAANSYQIINKWVGPDCWIITLTATPERMDGKGLRDISDVIVPGPNMRYLIDQGYLCDFDIYSIPPSVQLKSGEQYGDLLQTYWQLFKGLRGVVMCGDRKHAHAVAASYSAAGIACRAIDGTMPTEIRQNTLAWLENTPGAVLTSVNLMTEGVDVPNIQFIQWARKTGSLITWRQGNGRGFRPHACKDRLRIGDHAGNAHTHGALDEERMWSLDGRVQRERLEQGKDVYSRLCDSCYKPYAAQKTTCPYCGVIPTAQTKTIIVKAGELIKLEQAANREALEVMRKRDGLRGVVEFAIRQGYDNPVMWAAYKYGLGSPQPQLIRELQGYYDEIRRNKS